MHLTAAARRDTGDGREDRLVREETKWRLNTK